ncbi:hypothetical protein O3P69_005708 [Scylla paramamosain]|uniref:Uncharacterized protein n=1 Tax=Scylla paramamosain TaxID=85552 RepID=A0AAW0U8E6_SCYPA
MSSQLRLFIKEHQVTALTTAVEKADNWASAYNACPKHNTNSASSKSSFSTKRATSTESDPKNASSQNKCYNCREGHFRNWCPKNPRAFKDRANPSPKHRVGFCMSDQPLINYTVPAPSTILGLLPSFGTLVLSMGHWSCPKGSD